MTLTDEDVACAGEYPLLGGGPEYRTLFLKGTPEEFSPGPIFAPETCAACPNTAVGARVRFRFRCHGPYMPQVQPPRNSTPFECWERISKWGVH